MSFASLERQVLLWARITLNNPRLRAKDILEWRTGLLEKCEVDEITVLLPHLFVSVCVKKVHDLRTIAK